MSFDGPESQVDAARTAQRKKEAAMFEDLAARPRSFFSLSQLRKAKKISDGKLEHKEQLTEEDLANARIYTKLNLVNVRCARCEENGATPAYSMDSIIQKLRCRGCEREDAIRGEIQVLVTGDMGTYEIKKPNGERVRL